jgi:uncharacterized protein YyaL (SSP411 family)
LCEKCSIRCPEGGFYSTQDADSKGKEGKFFVWTTDEIREVLGSNADEFMVAYGATSGGNFEGKNILEVVGDMDQRPALAGIRCQLLQTREKRVHPGRDEKVLSTSNGLMLAAFAEADLFAFDNSAMRYNAPFVLIASRF